VHCISCCCLFLYHLIILNFRISNHCKVYLCVIYVNNVLIQSLISVYHLGLFLFASVLNSWPQFWLTHLQLFLDREQTISFVCFSCIPRVLAENLTMFRINLEGRHCCREQYSIYSFRSGTGIQRLFRVVSPTRTQNMKILEG